MRVSVVRAPHLSSGPFAVSLPSLFRVLDRLAPVPNASDIATAVAPMRAPRRAGTLPALGHAIAFLVPAILATNYTINRFYALGAAMWDSGWFAHLAVNGLRNPPAIGGIFLTDHMSLVFVLLSLVHGLTPATTAPVFFAASQGLWFGVIGLAASLCLRPIVGARFAVPLAVLGALNGISLATIGFPHIEIAIPALVLLMLALWARGQVRAAWCVLPLLLTIREDAGLHLATVFALVALWTWRVAGWRAARPAAAMAACGLLAAAAIMGVQHVWFTAPTDQLHETYLGSPMLAHVNWHFLGNRIYRLGQNRSYIYLPFLLTLAAAARRRDLLLAIGPLAGLPWLGLALVARSSQAGELMSYYGFPLMIGLCWPMVAAVWSTARPARVFALRLFAVNMLLSVALFAFSGGMHDRRPWNSFGIPNAQRMAASDAALDMLLANRPVMGRMIVDDEVGSLRPEAFLPNELRPLMAFSAEELRGVDAFVFKPGGWLDGRKREIIREAGLAVHYRIRGTRLMLFSRHALPDMGILLPTS